MVEVIVRADCGNSPKNLFLKQFSTAFAEGNIAFLSAKVSDDISWEIIGTKSISGKSDFVAELERINFARNAKVLVKRVITHGKEGAVNGEIVMTNGKKYAFCDFYEFTSAKGTSIKVIESYNLELG